MQIVKFLILAVFVIFFIVFAFQNFESVTISIYKYSITLPLAVTAIGIYILGMLTGGLLWSTLKKLARKEKE